MTSEHIETVIIGAGQAGLSTGYHLMRRGRPFVILDGGERVGGNWRQQWDTLRLYTPAKYDGLPGLPFPAKPWHYPHKDEVAAYLESYAVHWDLPVRMSTRVDRVDVSPSDGYSVTISDHTITCDNVVVATGTFGRTPLVPDFADELDPSIRQLHSSDYRRPAQLQDGPVVIVGASHSGVDIAYETATTNPTILCGRDCGQIPFHVDSRPMRAVFPVLLFVWKHILTRRTPMGRKEMHEVRSHGGPMLRIHRKDLENRGIERHLSRMSGVLEGKPVLADGTVLDVANVVWCTGFRQSFEWIRLPIFGENGWPLECRGVVDTAPGLFFCGLSFQFAFSSMLLPGVGRDAGYVASHIEDRSAAAARPLSAV